VGSHIQDRMSGVSVSCDDGVESVPVVSSVLDCTSGAIGFNDTVVSVNFVANASFGLFFDVIGLCIINIILKLVAGFYLKIVQSY
jgi:hypothetical protein